MTANRAGISLVVDGVDLAARAGKRLMAVELAEKREGEADEITVTLDNADGLLAIPEPGKVMALALGWVSGTDRALGLVDKGQFTVDEIGGEGPPDIVTIKGRSADMTGLLRKRRTKAWKDTTLGAVLRDIAARHGRSAKVDGKLAALAIASIEQEGKSDMAFVRDLGRRYDAIATWKAGLLVFLPIGASATASGTPLAATALTKRAGWRWTYSQADRESYDGAEAHWHDADGGRRRTVKTGGDNRRKLKRVYASEGEAQQAAKAAASRAARKPFKFTYDLAIAEPALQPDGRVTLSGWGDRIDGLTWLIEEVTTSFDGSAGLTQALTMESL